MSPRTVRTLPYGWWDPKKAAPNTYHIIGIDPGGVIGWAHLVLDYRAFSRPDHSALAWLTSWQVGEFSGGELDNMVDASNLIYTVHFPNQYNQRVDVVGEDFELTQLIGGKNLLSPVRINAVLEWECAKHGLPYFLQKRQARTVVTAERLRLFGFPGKWPTAGKGKDAFSAMQHAVTWLRRIKAESRKRPWKLSDGVNPNAYWDCACAYTEEPCDLKHPR